MTEVPVTGVGRSLDGRIDDLNMYRRTLGSFLTGVTVITAQDAEGRPRGITANSFTSVSLEPPLVLFCIDYRAASYEVFRSAEGFVVHILSSEQQGLAKTFASKSEQKFEGVTTTPGYGGAPILDSVHGWIECRLHDTVIAGDHAVIIGEVLRFSAESARPLGFYQGRFFGFNTDQEIAALASESGALPVSWIMQSQDGSIVTVPEGAEGRALPSIPIAAQDVHPGALASAASRLFGSPVGVDFLYSVYETTGGRLALTYRGQVMATDATLAAAGFVCVSPQEIRRADFSRPGEGSVVERYVAELADARFGVYAGTLAEGAIARVTDVQRDERAEKALAGQEG